MNPSLYIDFTLAQTVPPFLKCNRGGATANYFSPSGKLLPAPANTPRFGSKGLMIEPSATNLMEDSRDLTAWAKTGPGTIAQGISLDGTLKNIRIINLTGSANVTLTYSLTGLTGTHTLSLYVTAYFFNLIGGSVAFGGQTKGFPTSGNKMITVTGNNPSEIAITIQTNGNAFSASDFISIDCVQVEATSYATSPIHTNGTTVTRNQDECYLEITQSATNTWFDRDNGTLLMDLQTNKLGTTQQAFLDLNAAGGGSKNIQMAGQRSAGTQVLCSYNGAGSLLNFFNSCDTPGELFRIGTTYVDTEQFFSVSGKSPIPYSAGSESIDFSLITRLYLGIFADSTEVMNGYIRRVGFYKATVDQITLNNLTMI
jgi:hypothetical protein